MIVIGSGLALRIADRVRSVDHSVTPLPLDYERASEAADPTPTAGRWALSFAICAVVMDGVALAAALGDDGMGWAFAFPCLCINGLLAPACALLSACVAIVGLTRRKGQDSQAWLALFLAAVAAVGGILIAKWSLDAVASV